MLVNEVANHRFMAKKVVFEEDLELDIGKNPQ